MGTGAAARMLGLGSPERVRQLIRERKLEGRRTETRWEVTRESVERLARERRPDVETGQATNDSVRALTAEVKRLSETVERLQEQDRASLALVEAVSRERDRYRAESAAARGTALEVQASLAELTGAFKQALGTIERQTNALGQMLAPGSPDDLTER